MKTLDDAVIELNGLLPNERAFSGDFNCKNFYFTQFNEVRFVTDTYFCARISSVGEFQQRAKELGFVNGYRYGVEYPTNGKRPDLADDVRVAVFDKRIWENAGHKVCYYTWEWYPKFRITDQRYKPADTSYLENNNLAKVDDIGVVESDWYDYDNQKSLRLPPVGVECEVQGKENVGYRSFCKVKVVHHGTTKTVLEVSSDLAYTRKGDCMIFDTENLEFRPIDHATRKAEAEKKRVVDAVWEAYHELGDLSVRATFDAMYDAGYLRLPPEKN